MYYCSSSRMDVLIRRSLFCTAKTNCIRIWVYELAMLLQTDHPAGAEGIIFMMLAMPVFYKISIRGLEGWRVGGVEGWKGGGMEGWLFCGVGYGCFSCFQWPGFQA